MIATARHQSTLKPFHRPWLSGTPKPGFEGPWTEQRNVPRALTASMVAPAAAGAATASMLVTPARAARLSRPYLRLTCVDIIPPPALPRCQRIVGVTNY